MGSVLFRDPQALSSALAMLGALRRPLHVYVPGFCTRGLTNQQPQKLVSLLAVSLARLARQEVKCRIYYL